MQRVFFAIPSILILLQRIRRHDGRGVMQILISPDKFNLIMSILKLGLKLKTKIFKIETIKIDEIREKLVKGKKYISAYSKGEFIFTCTEYQSKNLDKFLGNDYKILK